MCLSDVPNMKEINVREGYFQVLQNFLKWCEEEKCEVNLESISHAPLTRFLSNLICKVTYIMMQSIVKIG